MFVRCSFDKWSSYRDYTAHYVPWDFYSSGVGIGGIGTGTGSGGIGGGESNMFMSSPMSSSISATFYGSSSSHHHMMGSASGFHNNHHQSHHHHKEIDTFRFEFELPKSPADPQQSASANSPNASIQFCICYRTGDSVEYWDNNDGKNYEILQYVIDIESLKPASARTTSAAASDGSKSRNYKYEGANSRLLTSPPTTPTNESTNDVYY